MLNLSNTPQSIEHKPLYDREKMVARIVHIGFGAFHRAHQALFTDRLLNKGNSDWAICEVNIVGGEELINDIRKQDHLYTVLEKGATSKQAYIIGSVKESLLAPIDGIEAILEKMADPVIEIVSLTVTEKGYCMLPGGAGLDLNNQLIKSDLSSPTKPMSAPGVIVEALYRRMQRGLKSFTALSCDNMPENGLVLKKAILDLANARDPELAQWIETNTTFPCTMVDRIVPAATAETLTEIQDVLGGMFDPCGIACEPFIQWVIEDNFVTTRPNWNEVGAEFVDNVVPYEAMKLRMLNGSHSFLAYLGYLAGYENINDCMNDEAYKQATLSLMLQQQAPTLNVPPQVNLQQYAEKLIERFSNPSLKHRTWQIAMDGTQKLPQRLLDSIRWHIKHNSDFSLLALGVAGWMRYVGGIDDHKQIIDLRDPMVDELKKLVTASDDGIGRVNALLTLDAVFGSDLPNNSLFKDKVTQHYLCLMENGAKQTIQDLFF
ncbi:fructuronate reductase [Gilliamella sp. B14384H2]|uniref:mannitol dehydrogenase family protein n=1 Tax=unclassified Gilliamella TaxID=2685620 RepID=UPI0018DC80AA|nr:MULTISPECIES: fructuronate reductase [unclassified Gilliamella]MBI0038405.1 fructuronate reductase [Gilliamella sp. B14384G10]MBI0040298.1 fructuronate reductase [Gilliamella sp. B14384G7]MBI0052137.1 fructuronate reductase [Gilliamella sp. B14384G13]MBI0054692.1 fructuronate reductase [Gilliamella sp. B14384H2]